MTAPRHLWSGEWRRESAAAAEELANRRAAVARPAPEAPPPTPSRRTSAASRVLARVRPLRAHPRHGAAVTALAMLLSAAAGYAIASSLISSGPDHPARATGRSSATSPRTAGTAAGPAWLGVDAADLPGANGVVIVNVFPASPAATAGLAPGDVITQIDGRPVRTTADLQAVLAGLPAGERVDIQYERGPVAARAEATLAARPPHSP